MIPHMRKRTTHQSQMEPRAARRRDTGRAPRWRAAAQPALLGVLFLFVALLLSGCNGDVPYEARRLLYELESLLDELEPLVEAARWVFAIAGLALLVAGYKIYRFVIALPGFVIGALVGAGLGYAGADENWLIAILGLILGGMAGAALALLLHDLAVFLLGALIGGALAALVFAGLGDSGPPLLPVLIGAIIGGAGLLALSHLWIVVLSSFVGAVMFGFGVDADPGWMLIFFLGGIAVQYGLARAIGDRIPRPGARAEPAAGPAAPVPRAPVPPPAAPSPDITAPISTAPPPGIAPRQGITAPISAAPPPAQGVQVPSAAPQAASAPAATLVSTGPGGEIYQVRDGSLVGRGEGCEIWLRDRTVSRRHARFRYAQGIWYVQDEGSTAGTMVNGVYVTATRLRAGDRIQLGDSIFTFQAGGRI